MPRGESGKARLTAEAREAREKELLAQWIAGDANALGQLVASALPSLRRKARSLLRFEAESFDADDLVNELYIRLLSVREPFYTLRSFYFRAYLSMRRILVDHARARTAVKRGGYNQERVDLSDALLIEEPSLDTRLTIESLLKNFRPDLPQLQKVLELRFGYGYSTREIATIIGISQAEVQRCWEAAKGHLREPLALRSPVVMVDGHSELPSNIVQPVIALGLVSPELVRALAEHPELMKTLDWRAFEYLLATILEKLEYEIELQRGTKDGGIDRFAIKRTGPFGPHRYILQAKRWSRAVDVRPVRELLFLQNEHRATKSCLATTSRFTRGAWKLADEYRWLLELRDYHGLQDWIKLCTQGK